MKSMQIRPHVQVSFAVAALVAAGNGISPSSAQPLPKQAPVHASVSAAAPARNVIIFVTDGLRSGSVNPTDAPTLYALENRGVRFANSHSLFPTFTTPNASAIATGHYLGDTGDFSNTVYTPFPIFNTGNFGNAPASTTPFVESNQVLSDIDDHFGGNYLTEESLLAFARGAGYNTAAIGKIGPVAIMDVTQVNVDPATKKFPAAGPTTIIIDDATGTANVGVPLNAAITGALNNSGITSGNGSPLVAAVRMQTSGNSTTPGTNVPNSNQQNYFADATTKAVLPLFQNSGKPFVLVYWSRDPDGTQHNQGDSLNSLTPGINGPTSKAAIKNADNNLAQILAYLDASGLAANTDIFVTADHGFNTISHHELDTAGTVSASYSTGFTYKDATGRQEVLTGFAPVGFVAIDLAHDLGLPLFDPDSQISVSNGTGGTTKVYEPVDPTIAQQTATQRQHPASGDGLIGGTGAISTPTDAQVVVAANGGSDLIYLPTGSLSARAALAAKVVGLLSQKDYVSGIFADDAFGAIPGALPLSAINLKGSAALPTPAIVVNFRSFTTNPADPINNGVTFCDSGLQEGQGMHGSFNRADTFNFMAAVGPDFKAGYVDNAPTSNADVQVTLANVLGFNIQDNGTLLGRVLTEIQPGQPDMPATISAGTLRSLPAANGQRTLLRFQQIGGARYFDAAGFTGRTLGL